MRRLHAEFGDRAHFVAVHTARGHRLLPREDVEPALRRFASSFAHLEFPVALDLSGDLAAAYGTEGSPHWIALCGPPEAAVARSVYGSQDNAQTRLTYWLAEAVGPSPAAGSAAP
ncbi:TlpA family protein disulfide reductase [Deinococcus lacus]|uniref:TlpA family protein disulfide reductase n=1 Tax=Deinococcus lacus TaxID=392561 RepID=UPI0036D434EA